MLFSADEKVLCFHQALIYEARVLKAEKWTGDDNIRGVEGPHYFVHYMGWKGKWDEWVPESRMMKLNAENIEKQQALAASHKAAEQAKKAEKSGAGASSSAAAGGSGGGSGGAGTSSGRKSTGRDASETAEEGRGRKSKDARGTKRGRDAVEQEDEYVKRPEIKINIPDTLKIKLVDDWENVTRKDQLVPLPRKPNVHDILAAYRQHYLTVKRDGKASRPPAVLDEILDGLALYFNKSLGNNLLYRFERAQYTQMRKEMMSTSKADGSDEQELDAAKVYGAEHLLRLFVNLPSIVAHTTMDHEAVTLLREHLSEFLNFIIKERKKLFVTEYEDASPAYHRLSSS